MSKVDSETLLGHLLEVVHQHPDRLAIGCGGERLRYREFRARILVTAARLRAHGIGEGDRVLFSVSNTLAAPILYFAVHAAGAVAVPLAPDTPESVLATLADDAEARLAVVDREIHHMPCAVASASAISGFEPGGEEAEPTCRRDAVADLLYTTGTTGRKKGVVLTHANVLAAARNITAFVGNRLEDVEVVPLPLSHSFGLGRLRCLAVTGHTLVLVAGMGNGAAVLKQIVDMRATGFATVPAGLDILRRVTGEYLSQAREHLRYVEIGSAPMKPETREWVMRMLPQTRLCHHYGLTEASRAAFTEYHEDANRPGTAGRATPNVEIVICDGNGERVAQGEAGEIVVRGGMVMREYWKQPELTQRVLCADGLKTGDIGRLDADGYLQLLGRQSDLINVGGRKVAPEEIENLLCQLDGVRDAGCIGQPDELLGESVKAFLVADREISRGEIRSFLRIRLEECKIPQTVERIAKIPRTSSGKIQRQKLREATEAAWTR